MANFGFSKNTYEVYAFSGGRWNLDSEYPSKSEAMERVSALQSSSGFEGVRVTQIDPKGGEQVVHEEVKGGNDAIKPVSVDWAPLCAQAEDVYKFPSRRTIGRVARQFLDSQGISALELLFDASRLTMIERMDGFFPSAMSMTAGVQAKLSGSKPTERSDALYAAFGRVRDYAKEHKKTFEEDVVTLETGGLSFLLSKRQSMPERLGALAAYMSKAGDWGDKVQRLLKLAGKDVTGEGLALVDGAVAEIMDGAEAVKDILGGQKDTGSALMGLAQLARGHHEPSKIASNALVAMANVLDSARWPLTADTLFGRVARGLAGTRPLTREGGEMDRELFVRLIREATDSDGLVGGPAMVEAVVMRAKIALGRSDDNLSTEGALEQILFLLPSRAARLGMLLDACRSGLWERYNSAIMGQLAHMIRQVQSIHELVPDGTSPGETQRIIEGLKARVEADDLPQALRESLGKAFRGLLENKKGAPPPVKRDDKEVAAMASEPGRKSFADGTVIFSEGDEGAEAFVIASGQVDILSGNRLLATVGKGEIIGEIALIDNQPRMASARASGDVEVICISQENLKSRIERLGNTDRVMRLIMDTLVRRLRGGGRVAE